MPGLPVGQERVRLLYEEYVHYSWLKQVWDHPVTDRPGLEPAFAAACHGIELAFLQMAEFINDWRAYVAKRPRIEAMALDIRAQLQLLGELVDGELEEEGQPLSTSLTQDFPFDGCPPTTPVPAHSPGLARLIQAVEAAQGHMSSAERNSLIKGVPNVDCQPPCCAPCSAVECPTTAAGAATPSLPLLPLLMVVVVVVLLLLQVSLQITSAFQAAFQRWTVGLGIEHQLNTLLEMQGIMQRVPVRAHNLDYMALVRPQVVEATLTAELYENAEDFFFRSIHLGTECWMAVANWTVAGALGFARSGQWHVAASRITQAARVLTYLGDHIMTLTRMNLRDYLELKVQLEGTSGAGSSQVRAIRGVVLSLMEPLREQVLQLVPRVEQEAPSHAAAEGDTPLSPGTVAGVDPHLLRGVMHVYVNCDKHPGLYNYAKALEDVESALLGGFYYKHYCLAANVIGSEARGTMRRAVAGLKTSYERQLFPVLDAVRSQLGKDFDEQLAHMKGRMMDAILTKYSAVDAADAATKQRAMIPSAVASIASAAAMSVLTANARTATAAVGSPAAANTGANATAPLASAAAAGMAAAAAAAALETAASARSLMSARSLASAVSDWDDAQSCVSCTGLCPMGFSNLPDAAEDAPENAVGEVHGSGGCPFMSAPPSSAAARACPVAHSTAPAAAAQPTAANGCPARHTSCPVMEGGGGGDAAADGAAAADGDAAAGGNGAAAADGATAAAGNGVAAGQKGRSEASTHHSVSSTSPSEAARHWLYSTDGLPADYLRWSHSATATSAAAGPRAAADADAMAAAAAAVAATAVDAGAAAAAGKPAAAGAQAAAAEQSGQGAQVSFLDHAWGEIPPRVLEAGLRGMVAAAAQGNAAWDTLFGEVMPKASQHVLQTLGMGAMSEQPGAPHVHWGHNSHELVWRTISCVMSRLPGQQAAQPLRLLTSDMEFYSFTRQMNALWQQPGGVEVEVVPVEPLTTFSQRFLDKAAEQRPDVVYCSQVTYLTQQALIPDISHFVAQLSHILAPAAPAAASGTTGTNSSDSNIISSDSDSSNSSSSKRGPPLVLVDGYHGFCALPTDLSSAFSCPAVVDGRVAFGYVAGLLKHAGCGPNAAFVVLGGAWQPQPLNTGWLADLSVLAPGSAGICAGSTVGYTPHLALQGGTPGYMLPLLCFNALMECWAHPAQGGPIHVAHVHQHVLGLQRAFVAALAHMEATQTPPPVLSVSQLVSHPVPALDSMGADSKQRLADGDAAAEDGAWSGASGALSHTLVFKCDTAQQAAGVVAHMASRGVAVDTRKQYVRLGLGFNHTSDHLAALLHACSQL